MRNIKWLHAALLFRAWMRGADKGMNCADPRPFGPFLRVTTVYTVPHLASEIGVSPSAVRGWMAGKHRPDIVAWRALLGLIPSDVAEALAADWWPFLPWDWASSCRYVSCKGGEG